MPERNPCRKALIAHFAAAVLWTLAILWLSLTPNPPKPDLDILSWDKLQHAGAYGLLALLFGRALVLATSRPGLAWVVTALAVILFGGLLEILQMTLTQVRVAEWGDLLADALGATAVCLLAWALGRTRGGTPSSR